MAECFAILGDVHAPYHDPRALEVACAILQHVKPSRLVMNGDWWDMRVMASAKYPTKLDSYLSNTLREERERLLTVIKQVLQASRCKHNYWLDGNHEWRLWRAMSITPNLMQVLALDDVAEALSIGSLLGLKKLGIKHVSEYPGGMWLREDMTPEKSVWGEHGYLLRKRAAYTATGLMDERGCNVFCGHTHRLGLTWRKFVGGRQLFAMECGTLSLLGEPAGKGIYTGVPHSTPEYLNHQQGFALIWHDGDQWFPELVRINKGVAFTQGKRFKA